MFFQIYSNRNILLRKFWLPDLSIYVFQIYFMSSPFYQKISTLFSTAVILVGESMNFALLFLLAVFFFCFTISCESFVVMMQRFYYSVNAGRGE